MPPAQLRARIGPAHADLETFLRSGEQHAQLIRDLLHGTGSTPESSAPLLDFGCGCGRVARHWDGTAVGLHGCDVNARMVAWCNRNLKGQFEVNRLEPPLAYPDETFGLLYLFSVFTHLPGAMQLEWVREFDRVLRPGGYLIFTTLGEYYLGLDRLRPAEQRAFEDGELVVLFGQHAGESFCSAYHPRRYVETTLSQSFEYLDCRPGDDVETHDVHLLRKPLKVRDGESASPVGSG